MVMHPSMIRLVLPWPCAASYNYTSLMRANRSQPRLAARALRLKTDARVLPALGPDLPQPCWASLLPHYRRPKERPLAPWWRTGSRLGLGV